MFTYAYMYGDSKMYPRLQSLGFPKPPNAYICHKTFAVARGGIQSGTTFHRNFSGNVLLLRFRWDPPDGPVVLVG